MVHRALYGSVERFFGVLIEHYAGAFPVWLSPVQVVVIPIAERHVDYANKVAAMLRGSSLISQTGVPQAGVPHVSLLLRDMGRATPVLDVHMSQTFPALLS